MNDDPTRQSLLRGLAQAFEGLQRAGLTHTSRPALRDPSADDAPAAPVAYSAQESREEPPPVARSMPGETPSVGTFVDDRVSQQMPERQGVHDFDQGVARGAVDEPPPTVVSPAPTIRPAASPALFELDDAGRGGARPAASGQGSGREPDFAPVTRSDRETGLAILREEVRGCTQCALLSKLRKQTVFAAGNPNGKLVLVGEAPGADEDRLGEPFVGKAGKKLDEMLAAFGLDRTQVYIMNAIKCRPPENRVPAPDELANCRPFFLRQLDLLAPQFILCLGATAAQALLQRTDSISRLRAKLHNYRGAKVVCTYHPSYILRSPEKARRPVWEDLLLLMGEMGIRPKNKQS